MLSRDGGLGLSLYFAVASVDLPILKVSSPLEKMVTPIKLFSYIASESPVKYRECGIAEFSLSASTR